jgi:hypothetical protein
MPGLSRSGRRSSWSHMRISLPIVPSSPPQILHCGYFGCLKVANLPVPPSEHLSPYSVARRRMPIRTDIRFQDANVCRLTIDSEREE